VHRSETMNSELAFMASNRNTFIVIIIIKSLSKSSTSR
jgi:hypothetical protein